MPAGVDDMISWITEVKLIDYKDLTPEDIKRDTETIDGEFYQLPKTKLIEIVIMSAQSYNKETDYVTGAQFWATMRRYTPQKYEYYKSLVKQEIKIELPA